MTLHSFTIVFVLFQWILATTASPVRRHETSTLLFNSPAFQNPQKSSDTIAAVQAYVYISQPNLTPVHTFLDDVLKHTFKVADEFEKKLATAVDRMKLFGSVGVPDVQVKVSVQGCSRESSLPHTALKDLGFVSAHASLGSCRFTTGTTSRTAELSSSGSDGKSTATAFYSPPEGLGIISDVDDTIKVTNVLTKSLLIENTLYKDPVPVAGMPDLYSHLSKSLTTKSTTAGTSIPPQFLYVSGSPFQLYPFLSKFLESHYPDANDWWGSDEAKVDYKVEQINRIHEMYPKKSFLAVGDSTEMDPEVYGKIFKQHKGFLRCIWIHLVDGAKNSQSRFDAALEGVPKNQYRLYKDSEIGKLKEIDVAGGRC
ncbi:hypothetical protein D9757_009286 [Collybiopsis confluens]|uniref:Phosphatidate phosphatase APP1 catalytic domain-containing protein n=1 Tax=Collybiopsis confluens TaxID=2823264 RepID=A0A8H5HAB9_9AGAR|nr:hypothetical protein D9757_009286 [Collybiopsis confluens]